MPNLGQGQVQQMKRRFSAKILILQYLVPCFSLGSWTHRDNFCNYRGNYSRKYGVPNK